MVEGERVFAILPRFGGKVRGRGRHASTMFEDGDSVFDKQLGASHGVHKGLIVDEIVGWIRKDEVEGAFSLSESRKRTGDIEKVNRACCSRAAEVDIVFERFHGL